MKSATLQKLVMIATILLIIIFISQFYWLKKTYALEERQFNVKVVSALRSVVEQMGVFEKDTVNYFEIVEQPQKNYFIADIRYNDDFETIIRLVKKELNQYNVITTYVLGIYNSRTNRIEQFQMIVYPPTKTPSKQLSLPLIKKRYNYLAVLFPDRDQYIIREMNFWIFSSIVLMLVLIGFSFTIFDLLKQKRLSEIQKNFINNITHEFKTPLSSIKLSSEVLKNNPFIQSQQRLFNYANIIYNEASNLIQQVEKVLHLEEIERKQVDFTHEQVNVHEIIHEVVGYFEPLIAARSGNISLELKASHPIIKADKLHFPNIIFNLIDNAVKYCHAEPLLHITTWNERNGIAIAIRDHGIGIPKQYQKFLFQKFYRVPTGNIHDVKGFGLGLHYVKQFVKIFRGDVKVSSEPGKGSIFTLYFPI